MSIVLSDVSFVLPDGRVLLSSLSASFNSGRTGLRSIGITRWLRLDRAGRLADISPL